MEKNKPTHTIRGSAGTGLKLAIWRHDSEKGPWFSATLTRSYKTDDGQWKESSSINQDQFLEVAEMMREARAFVLQEQAKAKAAGQAHDDQAGYSEREERKQAGGRQR